MSRRKKGQGGKPQLKPMTAREIAAQIGSDTPIKVSLAHLGDILASRARESVMPAAEAPELPRPKIRIARKSASS